MSGGGRLRDDAGHRGRARRRARRDRPLPAGPAHPGHDSVFPWGTFAINITGSLLLGLVTGLALHHGLAHRPTVVLSAGFTGGYTTWSTWAWESLVLAEDGSLLEAGANIGASLVVGVLAAAAGLGLAAP